MRLYSDLALWNGLTIRRGLAGAIPKSTCDPSIWLIRGANKLRRNWINEWPNMGSRQRARNGGLWVCPAGSCQTASDPVPVVPLASACSRDRPIVHGFSMPVSSSPATGLEKRNREEVLGKRLHEGIEYADHDRAFPLH